MSFSISGYKNELYTGDPGVARLHLESDLGVHPITSDDHSTLPLGTRVTSDPRMQPVYDAAVKMSRIINDRQPHPNDPKNAAGPLLAAQGEFELAAKNAGITA